MRYFPLTQDRYSEHGEEDSGQVILRAREYETFDVVPKTFASELSHDSEKNREVLLKINEFKYRKAHKEGLIEDELLNILVRKRRSKKPDYEERKYHILKRPYTYEEGVNFTGEPEFPEDDEPVKISRTIF